jgi:hypothetical protein
VREESPNVRANQWLAGGLWWLVYTLAEEKEMAKGNEYLAKHLLL